MAGRHMANILVVDDDHGILESFDAMLGDEHELLLTDNGLEALELLAYHQPRLLFLDLKMSQPDGFEILRHMAGLGLNTRVVIVTAMPQDQYRHMARKYGIFGYLHKPLDVDDIYDIASQVLH